MNLGNILITGANRGIGLEFVKRFVGLPKPPLHVLATCREPEKAKELKTIAGQNSNVHILKLDLKEHEQFPNVFQEVKGIVKNTGLNVLINNAGVLTRETLQTVSQDDMMGTFEVNVVSPLFFTKSMLPLLMEAANNSQAPDGILHSAIVNISSQMGSIEEITTCDNISYRISKAGLNMLTKLLSVELKDKNIFVVALHPGWVQTDMGGPDARLSAQNSVQGMVKTLSSLTEEQHGMLITHKGRRVPW